MTTTEIVNGVVVGEMTVEKPYAFFDLSGKQITIGKWFETDMEAIDWFKQGWPIKYKEGAEMRVYRV